MQTGAGRRPASGRTAKAEGQGVRAWSAKPCDAAGWRSDGGLGRAWHKFAENGAPLDLCVKRKVRDERCGGAMYGQRCGDHDRCCVRGSPGIEISRQLSGGQGGMHGSFLTARVCALRQAGGAV